MTETPELQDDRVGAILMRRGWLLPEAIERALDRQLAKGGRIGELLVAEGVINSQQLGEALAEQAGIGFAATLRMEDIDASLTRDIPIQFFKNARALPIKLENGELWMATADPTYIGRATVIARRFGAPIHWIHTLPDVLMNATNAIFEQGTGVNAEDLVDEFDEALGALGQFDSGEPIDLLDATDEAPIIRLINSMLFRALRERASDIHFEPFENEMVIRFRVDGILYEILRPPKHTQANLVSRIKVMAGLNIAEKRLPQDGRIRLKVAGRDVDIRVSTLPTQYGERVVLRLLERSNVLFNLEELGFSAEHLQTWDTMIRKNHGIVLVTGPTGSGKTTTLYASLSSINSTDLNIITIEDPVEYQLKGVGQIQINPKIELTFASGLRSILRQDPDIILVGEIRDLETAEISIQASLTGHLVFSTLHTNDAPSAVTRLVDMGIEPFLVSSSLLAILAQRLVRTLCTECKQPHEVTAADLKKVGLSEARAHGHSIFRPGTGGCPTCMGTGYRGRTSIHELLVINEAVRTLILNAKDATTIRRAAVQAGMKTLRDSGAGHILKGHTSIEEVLRVTQEDLEIEV